MHHRYKLLISMCITILFCYLSKTYLNTNMYVFSAVAYFIMEITHSYNYVLRAASQISFCFTGSPHHILYNDLCINVYCICSCLCDGNKIQQQQWSPQLGLGDGFHHLCGLFNFRKTSSQLHFSHAKYFEV